MLPGVIRSKLISLQLYHPVTAKSQLEAELGPAQPQLVIYSSALLLLAQHIFRVPNTIVFLSDFFTIAKCYYL